MEREEERLEELMLSLATTPLTEGRRDKWCWKPNVEGFYTVRSAYSLLQGLEEEYPISIFKDLWQVRAPSNAKAFAWRALQGRIQTKEIMRKRGIIQCGVVPLLLLCGRNFGPFAILLHFLYSGLELLS